jgi:hypothetical protein
LCWMLEESAPALQREHFFFNLKTHKISFRFYSRGVLQKPASLIVPMATPRSGIPPPPTLPDASAMALRAMCSPSPRITKASVYLEVGEPGMRRIADKSLGVSQKAD